MTPLHLESFCLGLCGGMLLFFLLQEALGRSPRLLRAGVRCMDWLCRIDPRQRGQICPGHLCDNEACPGKGKHRCHNLDCPRRRRR